MTEHKTTPRTRSFARKLRRQNTPHEQMLWTLLRSRHFVAYKIRRQVPIGPCIADFVCYGRRLIVELDGSQQAESQRDVMRDAELERRGFRVLRIWNNDVMTKEESVLEAILAALVERTGLEAAPPHPPFGHLLPRRGEAHRADTSDDKGGY